LANFKNAKSNCITVGDALTGLGRAFASPKSKGDLELETFTISTKALSCSLLGISLIIKTLFSRRF
jgi:hypothetical protein